MTDPKEELVTMTEPIEATAVEKPEPAAEVVRAEVVPVKEARQAAIERAAETALAMPGVPGRDEFLSLAMQARILSMSGAAPPAVRDNPYVAFHVAMIGRDLGISPSAAIQLVDIIGKDDDMQMSLSPELLMGQVRRLKLGDIIKIRETIDLGVAAALEPGGEYDLRCRPLYPEHRDDCRCHGVRGTSEFTWEDARTAGLVGPHCTPTEHKSRGTWPDSGKDKGCGCRQGYKTYPKRMMGWRAIGFAASDWFPEASLGTYSPEELGAVVDERGRPIDPSTVDLPDGYGPRLPPSDERGWVDDEDEQLWAARVDQLLDRVGEQAAGTVQGWREAFEVDIRWVVGWTLCVDATVAAASNPTASPDVLRQLVMMRQRLPLDPEAREKFCAWAEGKIDAAIAKAGDVDPDPQVPDDAPDDIVGWAVGEVRGMRKIADVDANLTALGLSTDGDADARRRRLTAAFIIDRMRTTPERHEGEHEAVGDVAAALIAASGGSSPDTAGGEPGAAQASLMDGDADHQPTE